MENKEIWQEVEYPHYMIKDQVLTAFVSNHGRVRIPSRVVKSKGNSTRIQKERMAKLNIAPNGYVRCCAGLVHRLVARAFLEKPEGWEDTKKWTVNHIDHDKTNNHWTNLEWTTHKDNCKYYFNSDKAIGERNKPLEVWTVNEEWVGVYPSITHAAKDLGLYKSAIAMILRGRNKTTGGYKVKLITPEEYHAKKQSI